MEEGLVFQINGVGKLDIYMQQNKVDPYTVCKNWLKIN